MVSKTSRRLAPSSRIRRAVEFVDQDVDRNVQLCEPEEAPVAQPGQNPSLDDKNRRLHLGFIVRHAGPRRHSGGAVMGGEILVGRG